VSGDELPTWPDQAEQIETNNYPYVVNRSFACTYKAVACRAGLRYSRIMKGGPKHAHGAVKVRGSARQSSMGKRSCTVTVAGVQTRPFSNSAFSLLELLVVVALIIILTTLYWGGSSSAARQKAMQAECENNLQKTYIALEVFANEHQLKFPEKTGARVSAEALDELVPRYTSDTSVFTCPVSKDRPVPAGQGLRNHSISYAYYMGRRSTDVAEPLMSDRQVDAQSKVVGQTVFSATGKPPGNNHGKDGGNFLFCDGHVQRSGANAAFSLVLTQGVVLLNP